ncbi:DUF6559 family protein [Marinomonas sp. THO17]|uniref:DUF6559 family protein n=1 Tax=Marinomonas sp. THO17 TaxID=3149048 RepID=UPI00336BC1B1
MVFLRNSEKKTIQSYIKKLPSLLEKDYGKAKYYTPMEIRSTIVSNNLCVEDLRFAIAIFSNQKNFESYHQEIGENCDYESMRKEIGDTFFNGNSQFSVLDFSYVSFDFGGDFDGGAGFSGGDFDGGAGFSGGGDGGY